MATATLPDQIRALAEAHRLSQTRRAALIAALVATYFRTRVNVEDPASVEAWLNLLIPRILSERNSAASGAGTFSDALRRLEMPLVKDDFRYAKAAELSTDVVRTSLMVTGPRAVEKAFREIRALPDRPDGERTGYDASDKQALMDEAVENAAARVAGAVARHVQDGARQVVFDGVKADPVALGWIRVTKADPCYFCAMLASRGIVYGDDSFDLSDSRFTGEGKAKVHDSCGCALKASYSRDPEEDPFVADAEKREAQWLEWGLGSGRTAVLNFRRGYEGREHLISA